MTVSVIPPLRNAEQAGEAFWQKLIDICARHGWDPRGIAAVMAIETGYTFSPSAGSSSWKPSRTATGLIQFIETTARRLGVPRTSRAPSEHLQELGQEKSWATWTLMTMTALEQLDLVEKYFERAFNVVGPTRPVDYYLVTWGTSAGRGMSDILAKKGSRAYEANQGLDRDRDGAIEVSDLNSVVMGAYPQNWQPPSSSPDSPKPSPAPTDSPQPSEAGHISFSQAWLSWGSGSSHLVESRRELPTLRYGSQGPAVALCQALLSWRLNRELRVDGGFGMQTHRAVVAYQELMHEQRPEFKVDGIVGRQTWSAIIFELELGWE